MSKNEIRNHSITFYTDVDPIGDANDLIKALDGFDVTWNGPAFYVPKDGKRRKAQVFTITGISTAEWQQIKRRAGIRKLKQRGLIRSWI